MSSVMDKLNIPQKLMEEFTRLLGDYLGLYFPKEEWRHLEKKLLRTMVSFGYSEPDAFLDLLKQNRLDEKQISQLAQFLTIGETYFFRDTKTFNAFQYRILPELLRYHQHDRKMRIWSAGCCSGEEPYSIAMILNNLVPRSENWEIEIIGTDINAEYLKKAEKAHYKMWSFRSMPEEMLKKYFYKESDNVNVLKPEIRQKVKFRLLNLVDDQYPSPNNGLFNVDLILCHNVLIYFSKSHIMKIVNRFSRTLREGGFLSVSAIEVPFILDNQLTLSEHFGSYFFYKKSFDHPSLQFEIPSLQIDQTINQREGAGSPFSFVTPAYPMASTISFSKFSPSEILISKEQKESEGLKEMHSLKETHSLYEKCLLLCRQKKFDEALSRLLAFLLPCQKDSHWIEKHLQEVLLIIQIYANIGDGLSAIEWIEVAQRADKLNPMLYYLHGTILHGLGDIQGAIRSLKIAIYLDSNFAAAHYMLGVLEQSQNRKLIAKRHFKNALNLLQEYEHDKVLPGTDELTAGNLKNLLIHFLEQ